MADEALKLPALERLKLQVAVIQLHIDAMEKIQNSNSTLSKKENNSIKNEKKTEPPELLEPEIKTSSE